MLGHIGINVPDLDAARLYYDAIMPALGFEPFVSHDDEFAYKPAANKRGTYLFVYPAREAGAFSRHRSGLQHLAFMMSSRAAVRVIHALVVALGNEVLYEPQEFPQYPPPYFATFWLDPFGIMLEAVCHYDRD
jgi:catechol 2,3-dioxygenase-like lactoylglutathione lyase family enzyme